ncbi:hypothetical protein [Rhodococcus spongiicola]|uniref:Uncharacterized protein n=1 Tax=Rhodococcus spongiicola TaxID=2487352 RepID=A0A438AUP9_9NOCA|nr:hypothetical protein [Rhodococcus spongiicola]RVW02460.1 hypothetical protein EF834_12860 [Rhodococcus spongiicola]
MSRTDAHSPIWVRLIRRELEPEPWHFCFNGACDLPDFASYESSTRLETRCAWFFKYTGTNVCSCDVCRDQVGHRLDLRRERRAAASRLELGRRQWELGNESAFDDVVVPHRNRDWW